MSAPNNRAIWNLARSSTRRVSAKRPAISDKEVRHGLHLWARKYGGHDEVRLLFLAQSCSLFVERVGPWARVVKS